MAKSYVLVIKDRSDPAVFKGPHQHRTSEKGVPAGRGYTPPTGWAQMGPWRAAQRTGTSRGTDTVGCSSPRTTSSITSTSVLSAKEGTTVSTSPRQTEATFWRARPGCGPSPGGPSGSEARSCRAPRFDQMGHICQARHPAYGPGGRDDGEPSALAACAGVCVGHPGPSLTVDEVPTPQVHSDVLDPVGVVAKDRLEPGCGGHVQFAAHDDQRVTAVTGLPDVRVAPVAGSGRWTAHNSARTPGRQR